MGYIRNAAGAVGRSLLAWIEDQPLNIKDFGGVADGVSDNAAALVAAYTALPAHGGEIYFPPGEYALDSAVVFDTLYKRVTLKGAPGSASTLIYTPTTGTALTFDYGNDGDYPVSFGHGIEHLNLVGPGSGNAAVGIVIGGTNGALGFRWSGGRVTDFGTAVQHGDNAWQLRFEHLEFRNNDKHLLCPSGLTEAGDDVSFDHCQFSEAATPAAAVEIQGPNFHVKMVDCGFGSGIKVGSGSGGGARLFLVNPNFEQFVGVANFDHLVVDTEADNFVGIQFGYWLQSKTSSPPAQFATISGGKVSVFGFGMYTEAAITNFVVLANDANFEIIGFNDISGNIAGALIGGSTTGYVINLAGAGAGSATPFDFVIGGANGTDATLEFKGRLRATARLAVRDTAGDHDLAIGSNEDLSADRTLLLNLGDADRILQLDTDSRLDHGTYSPTLTGVANVDGTPTENGAFQYLRVGGMVIVTGRVNIDATAAGGATTAIGISLPVDSDLADSSDLIGSGAISSQDGAVIAGDPANDRAQMVFLSQYTDEREWKVFFMYQVL